MSEIRVDTISEKTSANGVAVDGVTLKDGGGTFTSPVLVPDGSTSAVSLGNDGDPNTGIYFQAADSLGLVLGGSRKLSATSAGVAIENGALSAKGGVVFNEDSADVDFRVESNGNANMLFVDGGNNRVGIGGTGASYGQIGIENAGDAQIDLFSNVGSGTVGKAEIFFSSDSGSDHVSMASIVMIQDGAGDRKGEIRFNVSDNGGPATAVTIANNKNVTFAASLLIGGTGAANTLDDYEEGTWTPVLGSTGSYSGQQYAQQVGNYTKIGRQVTLHMVIQLTDAGTVGDYSTIFGLPFTPASTSEGSIPFAVWKITLTSGHSPIGIFYTGGSARIYLQQQDGAGTLDQVAASGVADDARLYMTATFLV